MSYQKWSHQIEPGEIVEYQTSFGKEKAEFVRELTTEQNGAVIVILVKKLSTDNTIALRYARGRMITLIPPEPV